MVIFLETADRIGARLCRDAIWVEARCNWIGGYNDGRGGLVYRALGPTVYDGASGIALFLARLYRAQREPVFSVTAAGALRQAWSQAGRIRSDTGIGFYSGLMGLAYVSSVAGEITGKQECIERALQAIRDSSGENTEAAPLDVLGGSAGAIPVLLHMHCRYGGDWLLDLAIRHGERLLQAANRTDHGWSWKTLATDAAPDRPDLTGFSHGAAGISWALLELFRHTRDERFRHAAGEGFRYERDCFNAEQGNWPDFLTVHQGKPDYAKAWCHGAPGIGLSRLRAWQILGEAIYREESEVALQTTVAALQDTSLGNYSLCHGHAGNAELLLYASQIFEDPAYRTAAERVAREGIERYENERIPWPCGGPDDIETPDLMLGLAGIGYSYLRLYDPVNNPSVLIL